MLLYLTYKYTYSYKYIYTNSYIYIQIYSLTLINMRKVLVIHEYIHILYKDTYILAFMNIQEYFLIHNSFGFN